MKLAVLPFNAAEGTSPALARQFANLTAEIARARTGGDIHSVSYIAQVEDAEGQGSVYVNLGDALLDRDWIDQVFADPSAELVMDGLLRADNGRFAMTVRFHAKEVKTPTFDETWEFTHDELFPSLQKLVGLIADKSDHVIQGEDVSKLEFGTASPDAFLKFLEGYDTLLLLQQTQGNVTPKFDPEPAFRFLLEAREADPAFAAPLESLIQMARIVGTQRIGKFETIRAALEKTIELAPDDFTAMFVLGELFGSVGQQAAAADLYERALRAKPNEPGLMMMLGTAQMSLGMPANAERNFRKALELEGPGKASTDFLAQALRQTGREHEVPALWKATVDLDPLNSEAQAKYAMSLLQAGLDDAAIKQFEGALETLPDNTLIKRWYAPWLVTQGDLDRAMDFYEDVLDANPADVDVLLEYAQALEKAGRDFEVPAVLQNVLAANPDSNVRAQALAWKIELEEPKRVETMESARLKMERREFDKALQELRPLRNWLADYWKLWALLASGNNVIGNYPEAEDAAKRVIQLFPACEPAYAELATALGAQNRLEEAYSILRRAAAILPSSLPIFLNLALAAKRSGREDEARGIAKQIREGAGTDPEVAKALEEIEA